MISEKYFKKYIKYKSKYIKMQGGADDISPLNQIAPPRFQDEGIPPQLIPPQLIRHTRPHIEPLPDTRVPDPMGLDLPDYWGNHHLPQPPPLMRGEQINNKFKDIQTNLENVISQVNELKSMIIS